MIIHQVAFGNEKEAFVSSEFSNGLNIIFSDDNNKGKTIVIQSMMYCLGSKPIFPASFNFMSYFYYVLISDNGIFYHICRKDNRFMISHSGSLSIIDGESEFKRFWNKHIFPLPKIEKDGLLRIVDFELLLELFFIGQDKRDTSNIVSHGYYTKEDYMNTIFALLGLSHSQTQMIDVDKTKDQLRKCKEKKAYLLKEKPILKSKAMGIRYLSSISDKLALEEKIKSANLLRDKISLLNSRRNTSIKQKIKYENVLKDLQSLNRTIEHGEMHCLDCQSTRIGFSVSGKSGYVFDVSTPSLRKEILSSIKEKIEIHMEEIISYTGQIDEIRQQLREVLDDEDLSLEMLITYKDGVKDASDVEQEIIECDKEILNLQNALIQKNQINADISQKQKDVYKSLIKCMNEAYKKIDPMGNLDINNIFTQTKQVFSGSEETVFYLVKLYAVAVITKHNFPIVVDSFRAEDLSTEKESNTLSLFAEINNQKIFTTTLKREEVATQKYKNNKDILGFDFSSIPSSRILSEHHVSSFKKRLELFSIKI